MYSWSKYPSSYDLFVEDHSNPKKIKKNNWYISDDKIDNASKQITKTRKNLMSKCTRTIKHNDRDNAIALPQHIVHESTIFKSDIQSPKETNHRQYSMPKKKITNCTLKSFHSVSQSSSTSSDISRDTIIDNKKHVKIATSGFDMRRLAAQLNSAGRRLIKLATSIDVAEIDDCDIHFEHKQEDENIKKVHSYHGNCIASKKNPISANNSQINECSDVSPNINRNNCCSLRQYSSRRFKPTSTQSRRNKSRKPERPDDELNDTMDKNDSFNSIHSMDSHSKCPHRNEVHSLLDKSITPSAVLKKFRPENCDNNNIRMTDYDRVMSRQNHKKKTNKSPRMKKKKWFIDTEFVNEDMF